MKEQTRQPNWPYIWPPSYSRFHMLTWNPRSIYSFKQNGNNAGIITPTRNSSKNHPSLGKWRPALRKSRREQVIISRLRIGYTRLTHSFILKQKQQPQYFTHQTRCTVKHVLIEHKEFALIRKRFFKMNSSRDLFDNVKMNDVLSFLRETRL